MGFLIFFTISLVSAVVAGSSSILIIDVSAGVQELDGDSWKENRVSYFDSCFCLLRLFRFLLLG